MLDPTRNNGTSATHFIHRLQLDLQMSVLQLDKLPVDILNEIFTHLELADLCTLQIVCKRFTDIARLQYSRIFRKYRISSMAFIEGTRNSRRVFKLKTTLQRIGHYIRDLVIELHKSDKPHLRHVCERTVVKYCTNIEHLHIHGHTVYTMGCSSLLTNLNRLRSLTLSCLYDWDNYITHFLRLCDPATLESLTITNMPEVDGRFLLSSDNNGSIKHLKSLSLFENAKLQLSNVYEYLEYNKRLQYFEFSGKDIEERVSVPRLCMYLNDVEHLLIHAISDNDANLSTERLLPKLRKLSVNHVSTMESLIPMLPDDSSLMFLSLQLIDTPSAAVLDQIKKFPKLKKVSIRRLEPQRHGNTFEHTFNVHDISPRLECLIMKDMERFPPQIVEVGRLNHLIHLEIHLSDGEYSGFCMEIQLNIDRLLYTLAKHNRLKSFSWNFPNSIELRADTLELLTQFTSLKSVSYKLYQSNAGFLHSLCSGAIENLSISYSNDVNCDTDVLMSIVRAAPLLVQLRLLFYFRTNVDRLVKIIRLLRGGLHVQTGKADAATYAFWLEPLYNSHWNRVHYSSLNLGLSDSLNFFF